MSSPIRDLPLIARNNHNQVIDIKATMQAFAKELISWADEEKAIRTKRKYREAIRGVFKRYDKGTRIPTLVLVMITMQDLQVSPDNFHKLQKELELHIKFNRGGYLRTVPGKGGGVELTKT